MYPLMDQLAGFGKVTALHILQHMFSSYGEIEKIDLNENVVKMMGTYDPVETLAQLIDQIKKWRKFERQGGQKISNAMMVLKGITLVAQTGTLIEDIR